MSFALLLLVGFGPHELLTPDAATIWPAVAVGLPVASLPLLATARRVS